MSPDPKFVKLPKAFWANIRTISEQVGYVIRPPRRKGQKNEPGPIKVPTLPEIKDALQRVHLSARHLIDDADKATQLGGLVLEYFAFRASILNTKVERLLMTAEQARQVFEDLQAKQKVARPVPLNKQAKEKKQPAYFTGSINMLIEANVEGFPCDYSPQQLTTVTMNDAPLRTLARRIDGAFPSPVNPIAVWEIKEYYYTTTFGSRVADGVYESLLDGMELEELRVKENIDVKHYLMVDAHYTWWVKGRSYLCRIVDMMHMGYVDEVLFGREILTRLPIIVKEWVGIAKERKYPPAERVEGRKK